MTSFPFRCPTPPAWKVDWPALTEEFEWIRAMRDCPQDALFHAEGSVWTHVGMVCRALAGLDEFRALPELERQILFAAALLHDIAKPSCTRHEDGRMDRWEIPDPTEAQQVEWWIGGDRVSLLSESKFVRQ